MQTEFDWTRADQLGMVERWTPPSVPGVSAAAMKSVLRSIDSYGRGSEAWPSEATLARDCGLGVRTVKRAIKALGVLSLLIVERRGPHTVNHYRIVWTELALRCRGSAGNLPERSATVSERSATVSERSATMALREVPPWPPKRQGNDKETTTTGADVVVVELDKFLGSASKAVRMARVRGVTDDEIRDRIASWKQLPQAEQKPGTLFNWIAIEGSYRKPTPEAAEPIYGRGDGLSKEQVADEALRVRIVRAGRAAGASHDAIEQRLQAAGV
jgi:hypothetical protein